MYNYQCFQRDKKIENECKLAYEQFLNNIEVRKENKKTLYNEHKKRIDGFILSAIEAPIQVDEYIPPKYQPRAFLSSGKHVAPFKMNSHTTSERLQEIALKNSFLDGVPFHNTSTHKFRQSLSDVTYKPLKYTPSSGTIRIMDHLINSRTNQIPSFDKSKVKRAMKFKNSQMINQKNKKQIQQLFMPALRRKAYFNSMKSLLVETPTIFSRQHQQNQKQLNQNKSEQIDKELKKNNKDKKSLNEHLNRKQNAISALVKCKLIKSRYQPSINKETMRG